MKVVIKEYAGILVALTGAICFFSVFNQMFMGENSLFALLIRVTI